MTPTDFPNTFLVKHPFVVDSLTHLRNKATELGKFRRHSDQICNFLFAEAIRGLDFKQVQIETPMEKMQSPKLADETVIIPVLRAGLAMLYGAMKLLPKSKIGFVGMQRDEETAIASEYYWKVPKITSQTVVIVTDPMLATGGSILHLLDHLKDVKAKTIRVVCVVAAPEGIENIHKHYPNVKIFTAAIDRELNSKKYILPGIGDYGDRYFGTE